MSVLDLVRPDLRDFAGYSSARRAGVTGSVWLNANENPWTSPVDAGQRLNRYPQPQPAALRDALAALYGARPDQILIGRGSDEPIDLLVRALCRPQIDGVVIASPVFGMYAVSARLQDAPLIDVPLVDTADGFVADLDAMADAAEDNGAHLVFLCSPSNPTGQAIHVADIARLAARLTDRCVIVVDEAYGEFCDEASAVTLIDMHPNVVVLRTLSKAHALAAARIGTLIGTPELVRVLRNCQAPYPLPSPCVTLALDALAPATLARTQERVARLRDERARLFARVCTLDGVRRVYASQGNYLLVRFDDADAAFSHLLDAGVVVRDMRASAALGDALRISVGSAEDNDAVMAALQKTQVAA